MDYPLTDQQRLEELGLAVSNAVLPRLHESILVIVSHEFERRGFARETPPSPPASPDGYTGEATVCDPAACDPTASGGDARSKALAALEDLLHCEDAHVRVRAAELLLCNT